MDTPSIVLSASQLAVLLGNASLFVDPLRPSCDPMLRWDPEQGTVSVEATDTYMLIRQYAPAEGEGVAAWECQVPGTWMKDIVKWVKSQRTGNVAVTYEHPTLRLEGLTSVSYRCSKPHFPNTDQLFRFFTPGSLGEVGLGRFRLADLAKLTPIVKTKDQVVFRFAFSDDPGSVIRWEMQGDNAYGMFMPVRLAGGEAKPAPASRSKRARVA